MEVLKKYVHNRARPEGSIAKGYGIEEVIEFCIDFIPNLDPIGVPKLRHEGRLSGQGKKSYIGKEEDYFRKAHYTILRNSSLVEPYIEEHKDIVRSESPGRTEAWITCQRMDSFKYWLQKRRQGHECLDAQTVLVV
jgi:hypothetical protein